jgi:hypothetical protein
MDQATKFDEWAIVEVMGRQTFAGRVTEQIFGGTSFVRVDVPAVNGTPAFTKLIGAGSIYAITPTTEEVVGRYLEYHRPVPMQVYIPPAKQISASVNSRPGTGELCEHNLYNCEQCKARDDMDDEDEYRERDATEQRNDY